MQIHSEVAELLTEAERIRKGLHRIPEIGFEVNFTSAVVRRELELCEPDELLTLAGKGLKAVYYAKNPESDGAVAFRADMDGLSIDELNDVPYKSIYKGKMHACGHDGHMTILLLLAKLIHKHQDELRTNVVLLFQPAEEGWGGATRMIEDGALENPKIERIYGMHVWPDVPQGRIGVRWGPMMAITCGFDITVHGVSSHGANPQMGVDAVVSAAELISLLQTAITRNIDPHQGAVLTIGRIEGGVGRSIIADKVVMNATLRMFTEEVHQKLMKHIHAMAEGLSLATGAEFEITELLHHPCVDNPRPLVEELYQYVDKDTEALLIDPVMISEDFSCYQQKVPGLFMFLGIKGGKNNAPLHNPIFDFDEDTLLYGVEVYRRLLGLCKQ